MAFSQLEISEYVQFVFIFRKIRLCIMCGHIQKYQNMYYLWSYSERSEYVLFVVTFRKIKSCIICVHIQKDHSMYHFPTFGKIPV